MNRAKQLLKQAEKVVETFQSWADFSNYLYNPVDGLLTTAFTTQKEREAFLRTPEYRRIRALLSQSMDQHGLVEGAEPVAKSGRFVVRLPKSLHAALEREARSEGTSLNQLVVAKLSAQLRDLTASPKQKVAR